MNILIIGSGAREHAMSIALKRSPQPTTLFCYGTTVNPGIFSLTKDYKTGDITDCTTILMQAQTWQIHLAVIGPEAPLEKGLADVLWAAGIKTIGPKKSLAKIETSKSFARGLMRAYHISGLPEYEVFSSLQGVETFLTSLGETGYVIKVNGLMGGKGVKVAGEHLHSLTEAIQYCEEILSAGHSFVIEEKLIGQEFSLMCFCDGEELIPMPVVQDHKRAYEGDVGPNTGGMGSYSDSNHCLPFLTEEEVQTAFEINCAVMRALRKETTEPYIGILYGSFIATKNGIYVIEFNARFGDPEALNVLSILNTDFLAICQAMASGQLTPEKVNFLPLATVCKYAVPIGYPDEPAKNTEINIDEVPETALLYFGAVNLQDKKLLAAGSRAVACVGIAETLTEAEAMAERDIQCIQGSLFHRKDIGTVELIQKKVTAMQQLRNP